MMSLGGRGGNVQPPLTAASATAALWLVAHFKQIDWVEDLKWEDSALKLRLFALHLIHSPTFFILDSNSPQF